MAALVTGAVGPHADGPGSCRGTGVAWAKGAGGAGKYYNGCTLQEERGYPPPGPPPLLLFQCLGLTPKILLRRLQCQEYLSFKIFRPAFGGDHMWTQGGGGSQPPPPPSVGDVGWVPWAQGGGAGQSRGAAGYIPTQQRQQPALTSGEWGWAAKGQAPQHICWSPALRRRRPEGGLTSGRDPVLTD